MKQGQATGTRFGVLGIAAAACVVCCAGPILALLGGLSLAALASTLVIGSAGVVIAVVAGLAFVVVRRRRTACGDNSGDSVPVPVPVPVAAPARRAIAAKVGEPAP
jgi:hypothetical protein